MIERIPGTKNGYRITETSTNEDLQAIYRRYGAGGVHCLITNSKTYEKFSADRNTGRKLVTVNNKVHNNEFYVNHIN